MPAKPRPAPARAAQGKVPQVTLHEMTYSHHCAKVRKVLAHKGIAFERREVPYHDKRLLLKETGQDYVPWLQWGTKGVPWHGIVDFVEQQVPSPTLFPGNQRGQARMLEQWSHDILEEMAWRVAVPEFPATFTDEHERWVFEELQERKRGPLAALKEKQPRAWDDLKAHLLFLEQALDGRDWLLGEPSLADFAAWGALYPLQHTGKDLPKEFPRTRAWHQRVGKV